MKFELHKEEVEKWNSVCEIIGKATKHEPHAQPGKVQVKLDDPYEVTITYESVVFSLTATIDLETNEAEETGSVTVKADAFSIFGHTTKSKLRVLIENGQLAFKAGRSGNRIGLLENNPLNEIYSTSMADVQFSELLSSIVKVKASLKADKHRQMSDKINFLPRDSGKRFVAFATDGHRMFSHESVMVNPLKKEGFSIHMDSVSGLIEILEHYKDAPVQMWDIQASHVYLIAPDISIRIPTLQAMTIDPLTFKNGVVDHLTSDVTVSMKDLKAALKKCSSAQSLKKKIVKSESKARVSEQGAIMFLEDGCLIIGVAGPGFKMIEDVDVISHSFNPGPKDSLCRASFRVKYLNESLREIDSKTVQLRWTGVDMGGGKALQGVVINGVGEEDSFSVMMMMRPENENDKIKPER